MMQSRLAMYCIGVMMCSLPAAAGAQPVCEAPPLADHEVVAIIPTERGSGKRLPRPFDNYTTDIRRQGCHYLYLEYPVPLVFDRLNVFRINQHGVLVDSAPLHTECVGQVLTQSERSEIVRRARASSNDLRPKPLDFTVRVSRLRCLYLYFENRVSVGNRSFQALIIDPLGELLDSFETEPR